MGGVFPRPFCLQFQVSGFRCQQTEDKGTQSEIGAELIPAPTFYDRYDHSHQPETRNTQLAFFRKILPVISVCSVRDYYLTPARFAHSSPQ